MTVIQLHIYYLVYNITQITDLLQSIQFTVHSDTNSNTVTYIQSLKLQIYSNPFNLRFFLTLTVIQLHIYNPTNYRYIVIHSIYGSF